MAKQITLKTPRLKLRAAQVEDATALYEAFQDSQTMQYWSEPPHTDITRTYDWLSSMMFSQQNGITDFIICLRPPSLEDQVIGKIGIYCARPSNEIGFLLDRRYWYKGLAKEALSAVLEYLFSLRRAVDSKRELDACDHHTSLSSEEMDSVWLYPSITADVDPRNSASIRLLKKVGFLEGDLVEACFQRADELVDSLYLRLQREEWIARSNP